MLEAPQKPVSLGLTQPLAAPISMPPAAVVPLPVAPAPVATPQSVPPVVSRMACPHCSRSIPVGSAYCQLCGARIAVGRVPSASHAVVTPSRVLSPALPTTPAPARPSGLISMERPKTVPGTGALPTAVDAGVAAAFVAPVVQRQPIFGRVVLLRPDGTAGATLPIEGDVCVVGRAEGNIVFRDDNRLAPRHFRLEYRDQRWVVQDLGEPNGVYVAAREPMALADGDWIWVGRQMLRFERIDEDGSMRSAIERGVQLVGSWLPPAWGRLRQLADAGDTRDVLHLTTPEVVIGREEGDIRFPYDDCLAPRHAVLRRSPTEVIVTDLGGGTFVRVRNRRVLANGDVLRAGGQSLRIEF